MKELSIEDKAKRYDVAIEKLRSLHDNYDSVSTLIDTKEELENIFPELAESDIRMEIKNIITYFYDSTNKFVHLHSKEELLAWIENKGKHDMGISKSTKQRLEDNLNKALEKETPESWNEFLEKQGEQNPKFRVGDTIKCKYDDRQFTIKSVDLDKGTYTFTQEGCGNDIDYADEEFELVEQNPAWSEEDERRLNIICSLLEDIPSHQNWLRTLKDRVLMTKVTYGERDKEKLESIINKASYNCCLKNDDISFLKSLKDRVQPKQEWSAEDEEIIIKICQNLYDYPRIKSPFDDESFNEALKEVQFIKSLKDRYTWKPSDQELGAILVAIGDEKQKGSDVAKDLLKIYQQLKKLK